MYSSVSVRLSVFMVYLIVFDQQVEAFPRICGSSLGVAHRGRARFCTERVDRHGTQSSCVLSQVKNPSFPLIAHHGSLRLYRSHPLQFALTQLDHAPCGRSPAQVSLTVLFALSGAQFLYT
jgi:hypothetical protein